MVLKYKTLGFNCYNVKYCPQIPYTIGCVSNRNYGIAGSGALFICNIINGNSIACNQVFEWKTDSLYDLCWSEIQFNNILWTVSADGFIQVWDLSNKSTENPIHVIKAHKREIYCCDWSSVRADSPAVLTASADLSIKLWDALNGQQINQYLGHESVIYSTEWSPIMSGTFASTSGDSTLRVWSVNDNNPSLTIKASFGEILSCDWNKFNEYIISTSDTNGVINVWDMRSPANPFISLFGHTKAVKKARFSPHRQSVLGSVSYDMTTRLWDTQKPSNNCLLFTSQQHREFVYGFDFDGNQIDQMVDCSWDQFIHVFSYSNISLPINNL